MLLRIASDTKLSPEESSLIERRIRDAMARLATDVEEVNVVVRDVNGPKGGVDQFVRLTAHLKGLPAITVSDCHRNVLGAATNCAERLSQSVRRQVNRYRHRRGKVSMSGDSAASSRLPAAKTASLD